tara:strand:+ start:13639 stop:14541 length:903 start_codon:yes stop_codon:yes gene_type:complete
MVSSKLRKYTIVKKIGQGAFGKVYKARLRDSPNTIVAIKSEENEKNKTRLRHEIVIYNLLDGAVGFPKLYDSITTSSKIIIVMEYLGPNLEKLCRYCDKRFSLKTILMLAIQILNRIEKFHGLGYIHRDIKPDNFLIGVGEKKSRLYLIDFGLAKKIITNGTHIRYRDKKSFTGSYRYSSIRNHKGIEQGRRDDLESIGYLLLYFLKGRLPWQGLGGSTKGEKKNRIFEKKNSTTLEDLCDGCPSAFYLYMKYCRILRFQEKPNYTLLKDLFINLFKKSDFKLDFIYDWNIRAKYKNTKG